MPTLLQSANDGIDVGEFSYPRNQATHSLTEKELRDCARSKLVNYIRCHDDIGWTFDDAVAEQMGIDGYQHRRFLNQFYTGKFEGSFSQGVPFQENPTTGDCRVCGSLASLAGLRKRLSPMTLRRLTTRLSEYVCSIVLI